MDAHLFRRLAPIFARVLTGARVERIHAPLPDITTLGLFAQGRKLCLVLRSHRGEPLLYLADKSPLRNPPFPPALTMRLRKHAENRRLGPALIDWIGRRMAFPLPGEEGINGYLVLDLREGMFYSPALPKDFPLPASWPPPCSPALEAQSLQNTSPDTPWRAFTTLTPALRRVLTLLDPADRAALLVDLEMGDGDIFLYGSPGEPDLLSAWPLPPQLLPPGAISLPLLHDDDSVLRALRAVSAPRLVALTDDGLRKERGKPLQNAAKRQTKLLKTLLTEQERLKTALALREDAVRIQSQLWRFTREEKFAHIDIDDEQTKQNRRIALDSTLTLRENMAAMFHRSDRALRGLALLAPRIAALQSGDIPPLPASSGKILPAKSAPAPKNSGQCGETADKTAQTFISSDGFTLLRGKNAQGNRELLKRTNPFDLWFHAEDGPSTHLILKRDHASHEPPEQTLLEAAALVALKSWQRHETKARIFCALAKHVHPVKGAPAGTMRVDAVWRSFLVAVDSTLEERLAKS